mmetsp:Transcript_56283/g.121278  ORF Transcript_56283/g.121278 Transcript_56283/m.121278 type:complete len:352 (+) Transcript_56283:319-1374(+)
MSGSEDSCCSGPSRKREPRPRNRSLAPERSATVFMCCPCGPRSFRVTRKLGSSSMPMKNWHWGLPELPPAEPLWPDLFLRGAGGGTQAADELLAAASLAAAPFARQRVCGAAAAQSWSSHPQPQPSCEAYHEEVLSSSHSASAAPRRRRPAGIGGFCCCPLLLQRSCPPLFAGCFIAAAQPLSSSSSSSSARSAHLVRVGRAAAGEDVRSSGCKSALQLLPPPSSGAAAKKRGEQPRSESPRSAQRARKPSEGGAAVESSDSSPAARHLPASAVAWSLSSPSSSSSSSTAASASRSRRRRPLLRSSAAELPQTAADILATDEGESRAHFGCCKVDCLRLGSAYRTRTHRSA